MATAMQLLFFGTTTGAITVGFGIVAFIFLCPCLVSIPSHSLRRRKKRPGWSSGAISSKWSLFVLGTSATGCQLVEPRPAVDSRKNPVGGSGQERERAELLRTMPR